MSLLNESIQKFNEKKEMCLKYIDNVSNMLKEYEAEFSSNSKDEAVSNNFFKTDDLQIIRNKINDSQLKILIAGQFKAGKSTLINAILGEKVLPSHTIPCTAVITEIAYGEKPKAILYFKENLKQVPEDLCETAKNHINQYNAKNVPPLEIVAENIGKELNKYLRIASLTDEEEKSGAENPYALCRLEYPLEICKYGAVLIDSPGLNEADERDKTTMTYVPTVDMILHVLTSLQCYGKPDAEFIERIKIFGNLPLIFLINRFDQVNSDDEREDLKEYAISKLLPNSTYGESGIFFLSSQNALNGRINNQPELLKQSGFIDFENKIANVFNNERGKIKFNNIKNVVEKVDKVITEYIPILQSLFERNAEELEENFKKQEVAFKELETRKELITNKIQKEIITVQKELEIELKSFFIEFCQNSLKNLVDSVSLPDITFFNNKSDQKACVDKLLEQTKNCMINELKKWSETKGDTIITRSIKDINESISWELRQFNEQLTVIRNDLQISEFLKGINRNIDVIEVEDYLPSILGTIGVSAVSYGTMLFTSLFTTMFTGPLGWTITVLAALATLVYNLFSNNETPKKKIKEQFYDKACEEINNSQDNWIKEITQNYHDKFTEVVKIISNQLGMEIEKTRQPILDAINQLKTNKENLESKKEKLAIIASKLNEINKRGKAIIDNL